MVLTIAFYIYVPGEATAADPASQEIMDRQTAVDREESSLSTPAAARLAEDLAKTSASQARTYILKFRQSVAEAESALIEAEKSGSQATIEAAQALYDAALQALDRAVANATGVSFKEITAMRTSGLGWVQIAYEIGVYPGALGLAQGRSQKPDEIEMATARNAVTGLSTGHGTRYRGKGMGLDRADAKKEAARGMDVDGSHIGGEISARFRGSEVGGTDGGFDS